MVSESVYAEVIGIMNDLIQNPFTPEEGRNKVDQIMNLARDHFPEPDYSDLPKESRMNEENADILSLYEICFREYNYYTRSHKKYDPLKVQSLIEAVPRTIPETVFPVVVITHIMRCSDEATKCIDPSKLESFDFFHNRYGRMIIAAVEKVWAVKKVNG